jgi:hypothetical protein
MISCISILLILVSMIWATIRTVRIFLKSNDDKLFNAGVAIIGGIWIGGIRLILILKEQCA